MLDEDPVDRFRRPVGRSASLFQAETDRVVQAPMHLRAVAQVDFLLAVLADAGNPGDHSSKGQT